MVLERIRNVTESPLAKIENSLGSTYKIRKDVERITRGLSAFSQVDKIALGLGPDFIGSSQYLRNLGAIPSASEIARSKIFDKLGLISDAIAGSRAGLIGLETNTATRLFQEQSKTRKMLNSQFHIGIDPALFGGIGKFPEIDLARTGAIGKILADLSRPSVLNGALMAMNGLMPKGVIADVLKQHVSPIDLGHASKFKPAFDGLTSIDETVFDGEILSKAIISTHDSLSKQDSRSFNLEYAFFLLALLTALMTARMLYLAEISTDLQQSQLEVAQAGATSEDMGEVIEAIEKSSSEISDTLNKQAENDRHIRYVHNDVRLRVEANVDAMVIQYIYPDQIVRIIEANGHWAKVEIIDYRTERPVRGWVPRSTLRHSPL